ncbi:MAG: hypothetical protein RLZZ490_479 [Cyanobacteriota bacterium]
MILTVNLYSLAKTPMLHRFQAVKSLPFLAIALFILAPLGLAPGLGHAQTPPAETYQPGFWQPVGRFNPKEPVKVKLINQTGMALDYDITTLESFNPDVIPSGDTRLLENFGDDAYIMIYPNNSQTESSDQSYVLRFSVDIDPKTQAIPADNIATITITKTSSNIEQRFYGHRTINLQKTGAIYFY